MARFVFDRAKGRVKGKQKFETSKRVQEKDRGRTQQLLRGHSETHRKHNPDQLFKCGLQSVFPEDAGRLLPVIKGMNN
jgi:hypothetical protein